MKALIKRWVGRLVRQQLARRGYSVVRSGAEESLNLVPWQFGLIKRQPHAFIGAVPDRFSWQIEKYQALGGPDLTANMRGFLAGNEFRNAGDLTRFYFLTLACDQVAKEGIPGAFAELGVYKGNTAFILAQTARQLGRVTYLFDTFEGFADDDLTGLDRDKRQEFEDTSIDRVKTLVGTDGVQFIKGHFPGTTSSLPHDVRFAFVHLDCDLYAPTKAALKYFYPRLLPGGFLVMHDYSSLWWEVERAVNEFFADKPEHLVLIPDKSGTAMIRKAR
jgi:O-methyltransferase